MSNPKRFDEVMRQTYPETVGPISTEPDNRGRVPQADCICMTCGHNESEHFDGWAGCDLEGCECDEYDGPRPLINPEAYRRFLAMLKKDGL